MNDIPVQSATRLDQEILNWLAAGTCTDWPQGGCQIFYRDIGNSSAGASETLILIHGYPESGFVFHKVVDHLSSRFKRILLVDLPGFGLSEKPQDLSYSLFEQADALLWVIKQCDIAGAHFIAHDMGDSILTELIAREIQSLLPMWFDEGILSATFTNGNMVMEEAKLVITQKLLRHHTIGPLINRFTNLTLFTKQILAANGASLDKKDIDHIWQLYSYNNGHLLAWKVIRYLDERDKFQNTRWLKALSQFDKPIHICWGEADSVAPIAVANHLKYKICPEAKLTIMPGVGHFCETHAPEVWSDAVLGFYE